jgi:hypothetical protein
VHDVCKLLSKKKSSLVQEIHHDGRVIWIFRVAIK